MIFRAIKGTARPVQLGLRENAYQFSLLVLVNAFVGAMVGMERSILPVIAEEDFALKARTAVLSATSPLMALPLSIIFLGEKLTRRIGLGTALCVVGILLVVA